MFSRKIMGIIAIKVPVNQYWRNANTDAILGVYDPLNFPVDDFGFVCSGGELRPAYAAEKTATFANNPAFRRQCDDGETPWPPTNVSQINGWPFADFGFSDCDSLAIGDSNYNSRQYIPFGSGTRSIVGGKYRIANSSITQAGVFPLVTPYLARGSMKVAIDKISVSDYLHNAGSTVEIGGIPYGFYHYAYGAGVYNITVMRNNVPQWVTVSTATPSFEGEVSWDGTTVRVFIDGIERFSELNSGAQTSFNFISDVNNTLGGFGSATVDFGPYEIRDEAVGGNLLYSSFIGGC